ncbi:ROK family protein [Rhodovulum sp. DZ06]|uniref:ROK family protein n=1 Tax=Rhodovulum sp. DZ06 TaxID=3425126 RepID=UPI003D3556B3
MRIGVDLGGTKIEAAALGPDGAILLRKRIPSPRGDYAVAIKAIAGLVEAVESAVAARAPRIGVGIPGSISPRSGLVRNANSHWLNDRALDADLAQALGRPVRCANDADCFAVSEARDGAAAGAGVVFGVIAGTGIGGGVALDGRPLRGAGGAGGEWGHGPLPLAHGAEWPGPACWCGRHGCLETWLSGPGLAADHARVTGRDVPDAAAVAALAAEGDVGAQATLDRHVDRFARGLAQVVNLLDPHVVVLGGGLSNLADFPERLRAALAPHVFSDHLALDIRRNLHGDSSGVRGAAWLWDEDEEGNTA